jgi:hypothetical protein
MNPNSKLKIQNLQFIRDKYMASRTVITTRSVACFIESHLPPESAVDKYGVA